MKKSTSLILAASVMLLGSTAAAKERPGAVVVLTLKDGRTVEGELYAVKADALIIVDARSESATFGVAEIRQVRMKKRNGRNIRTGAIIGSAAIAGLSFAQIMANSDGGPGTPQAEEIATLSALVLLGGAAGGLVGWVAGGTSKAESVRIESLSAEPLRRALTKLRKRARVPSLR